MEIDAWPRPRWRSGHWCYWFYEPTYRENIHLIWPVTEEQRRAYIRRYFGIEDFDDPPSIWNGKATEIVEGAGDKADSGGNVISLAAWHGSPRDSGILGHEVFHVTENILASRGVRFSHKRNNEPYAYLFQRLFTTCLKAIELTKGKDHGRRRQAGRRKARRQ